MITRYTIYTTSAYIRYIKRIKDKETKRATNEALKTMSVNPFQISLRTHQVNIQSLGKVFSSRVTGDLRLIWEFDTDNRLIIIALRLQGHDTVCS